MESFLKQYASQIKGVLSGFDRVRFSGTIRILANTKGLYRLLSYQSVLLKNFKGWAKGLTDTVLQSTEKLAERAEGLSAQGRGTAWPQDVATAEERRGRNQPKFQCSLPGSVGCGRVFRIPW
jgi:hypothetical protein